MRRLVLGAAAALAFGGAAAAQDAEDVLVMEIAGKGTVEIALEDEAAPQHAERLRTLAREGAYDGVAFHRVIDGFMAQTGDVEFGTREAYGSGRAGTGGSELPDLAAEFSATPFARGVVGMARAQSPDSANSQFFIMVGAAPSLDNQYTVVGRVLDGMDVVDAITRGTGPNGMVAEPDYIESVRVKSDL
jgi:peptidylprolyl isomerase